MDISSLSDDELWEKTTHLAAQERVSTADLIEHLAAVDDRRLWIGKGYGSMFELCVYGLRFSDGAAYKRIRAARAVRLYPAIGEMLRDGRLTLAAVSMLHPHLEASDAAALIVRACGMRIRKLEALLSVRCPQEQRKEVIRFVGPPPATMPARDAAPVEELPFDKGIAAASPDPFPEVARPYVARAEIAPVAPRLVRFAFTADEEFYLLLERVRARMRHKYPDGRLDGVLRDALKALLARKEPSIRWRTTASRLRR
ncbi:MAG: hypothetical protein KGJ84_13680 [Elusimicrobia bacterium]|nr:hypothetical protein [Elusimicrobiota bacterium]